MESIIDGTWGGGPAPPEFADALLMAEYHWSWEDLQATPLYVRRVCMDFMQAKFAHENEEIDRSRSRADEAGGGRGH